MSEPADVIPTKDWSSHQLIETVKEAVKDDSRVTEVVLEIEKRLRSFHDTLDANTFEGQQHE